MLKKCSVPEEKSETRISKPRFKKTIKSSTVNLVFSEKNAKKV